MSSNSPCAACKCLRRKCTQKCVFAPYFPAQNPQKFTSVHKVFGASNVSKLLNVLHAHQREDAVKSLAYEAEYRLRDPIYGCIGLISVLQHKLKLVHRDLEAAKKELATYVNNQPQPQPQQAAASYAAYDPYNAQQMQMQMQMQMTSQQQQQQQQYLEHDEILMRSYEQQQQQQLQLQFGGGFDVTATGLNENMQGGTTCYEAIPYHNLQQQHLQQQHLQQQQQHLLQQQQEHILLQQHEQQLQLVEEFQIKSVGRPCN